MTEHDPIHGANLKVSGAKADAGKNRLALVLNGFAHALEEVGKVGTYGAKKYSPNGWVDVPNGFERYSDALLRHLLLERTEGVFDIKGGSNLRHASQVAWNALARLELLLRETKQCQPPYQAGPSADSASSNSAPIEQS